MLGSQLNWSKNHNALSVQGRTSFTQVILVTLLIAESVHAVGQHIRSKVISHHLLTFSYLVVLKNQLYFVKSAWDTVTRDRSVK
jgi:hypothetical protein